MRTSFRRGPVPQAGFTLLELLISITLLGLILVLLFGGLRLGVRSWDAVQQQVDNLNTVRSVENFLRREMTLTYPYRWKSAQGQRTTLAFQGERGKLSFVAGLPSRIGVGGLYAISLEIEQNGKSKRLLWRQMPLNSQMQDFSSLAQAKTMVLAGAELSAVEDVWLSYLGRDGAEGAPQWVDHWESETRLPLLIRIQVRFSNGTDWPEFVVAPMLTSETKQ